MWLKLKKLYEVQGFNARYLTFTTLLSHHYNNFKFIENYIDQLKMFSQCLKEMNPTFSDWIILTVLLNNLEFTFNVFVMTKQQFIQVTTSTFNVLTAELIDEMRMKNNKSSVAMVFQGKSNIKLTFKSMSSLQCSHCKKSEHEKSMCFIKYFHKKKKFKMSRVSKQKRKLLSGKFKFNIKFSDKNDDSDNATTLSFMFTTESHTIDVWLVDTVTTNHLCLTHKFFLTYESIIKCLKMTNEPAQIIEKNTVSLQLVCADGDILEVILKNIMHTSTSSANLISDCCMCVSDITFNMCDCTLHHNDNIIEYASEVNELFQLHLNDTPQFYVFVTDHKFKISFKMWHWQLSHLGHTNIECLAKIVNSIDLKNLS